MDSLQGEWERIRSSSLVRNAGYMFVGQGLSVVCQAAYFILLARLLGSREYGIYVGAVATVSLLSQYSTLGSYSVFLRYVCPDPKNFALYWGNILVTTVTLGGLLVAVLTLAVPHVSHSYSGTMVLCIAIGDCLFSQLTAAASRVFQAFEKMRVTAILGLLTNLFRVLLAGFLLWRFHHASAGQWAVSALVVSFVAVGMSLAMVTWLYGKPAFSPQLLCKRTGEGFVFALSYSTGFIYNDVDKAMLGHYGMNAANGVYAMAYRAVDVACMPFTSIQAAAFPRFFQKGINGVQSTADYAVRIVKRTVPIALLSTLVMLAAAPITPYLVGGSFSESVSALRWLCLLPVFRSIHISAGDALTASGHQKLRLGSQATAAAFNFTTNLYLIPQHGWLGAAWASLATDGLLAIFNWTVLLWMTSKAESKTPRIAATVC